MTLHEQARTLKVHLHLPSGVVLPAQGLLRLRVEDVSAADRAAPVIAENAVELMGETDVTIEVPSERIEANASYSVFLHLDTNRSGQIEPGDYISPALHPVLTRGAPDEVEADLVRVGR